MKKKYTYFAIIIILFIVLYKLTLYFFNDQSLNNKVKFSDNVFSGEYIDTIDESKRDIYFNNLINIKSICEKLFYCKFLKRSNTQYQIIMPYEFLNQSIKIEGVFNIIPAIKKNHIEYQFDGTISNFTGDSKFPLNIKANLNIYEDNKLTILDLKWNLKSDVLEKITNKFGEGIILSGVRKLQSSIFKTISVKINKN